MGDVTKLRRKPRMPDGFNVGAVVKLKSGGSLMVITSVLEGDPPACHLQWHSDGFYLQESSMPVSCLRLANDQEIAETETAAEPEE